MSDKVLSKSDVDERQEEDIKAEDGSRAERKNSNAKLDQDAADQLVSGPEMTSKSAYATAPTKGLKNAQSPRNHSMKGVTVKVPAKHKLIADE